MLVVSMMHFRREMQLTRNLVTLERAQVPVAVNWALASYLIQHSCEIVIETMVVSRMARNLSPSFPFPTVLCNYCSAM